MMKLDNSRLQEIIKKISSRLEQIEKDESVGALKDKIS